MVNSNNENWNLEVENNKKKKTEGFDFKWPINDFIEKSTNWNSLFFKNISDWEIWESFESFLKDNYDHNVLNNFLEGKETNYFNYLINEVKKETFLLQKLYNWVLKLFLNSYDFDEEERIKLEETLLKEWKWDFNYLIISNTRRKKFLQKNKILSRDKIDKKDDEMLKDIFWNLDENLKNDKKFIESLAKFYNGNYLVEIDDLKNILDKLDDKNKLSLIQYFVPQISLSDVKKYWFLNDEEIKEIISEELKKSDLTEKQQEKFLQELDYSDFFVETSKLWENILNIKNINNFLQKVVSEYKESITVSKTWLEFYDINDFRNQALQAWIIPEPFKEAFSKFWVWSYMQISKNIVWWKKIYYFRVDEIEDSSEDSNLYFKITNVTNPTGWIIKNGKWVNTDRISFEDLFEKITKINSSSWLSEISFYNSKDELKSKAMVEEKIFLWNIENWEIETSEELKKVLDEIDPNWKWVALNEMAFRCAPKDWDKNLLWKYLIDDEVYVVEKVENGQVFLKWQWAMNFTDFALAFKDRECKRFKKIENSNDFFEELKNHENLKEWLKDFEFKDGKIFPKSNNHGEELEYLVAPDWEALMIKKLNFSSMDFVTWKYKEAKKEWEPNIFDWKWKWKWFDYNTMYLYLTSKKFTPVYNKEIHEEHEDHHTEHLHKHSSIFKSYMSCLSIMEMISWWSHILHTIEHKLKFWNNLRSAKFARALWKFLPESIQYEIESYVEQEESKLMEEKIKELRWMNTTKMIREVEHILASSKPYDPELEAALFAVVWKTWVLYPKWLKKYKWSFMWYEALWWKKWDKMYNDFKKLCENAWRTPFTEEYLVEYLLDYQTDKLNKRRNKFNKQYWNILKDWKKEEEEDGERKTRNKTTATWILDYIVDEFKNLTYWNWIWWIENFTKKWTSDGHVMWALPFIMITSWMTMDFLPEMVNTVFWYSFSNPVFSPLYLISKVDDLKIYNDYVAKVIELWKWKNSPMYTEFLSISNHNKGRSVSIERAETFWKKYWEELYPKINMSDGFVLANKDDEWNEALKKYYDKIAELHWSSTFKDNYNKELVNDGVINQDKSPIAATWWLISKVTVWLDGKFETTPKAIAVMYAKQFKEVLQNPEIKDEEKRKKLFKHYYTLLERQLASQVEWSLKWDKQYFKKPFFVDIMQVMYPYKWFQLFPWKYSLYNKKWEADYYDYNQMLDRKWEEFNSWKESDYGVVQEVWEVKDSIFDILK